MSDNFQEQGGVATMDPSAFRRWAMSKIVNKLINGKAIIKRRNRAEKQRVKKNLPHVVEYFHQVDDGYSYLASQLLQPLCQRYSIELRCHLVSTVNGDNIAEPELLERLSYYDSQQIAPLYKLDFPKHERELSAALIAKANSILASLDNQQWLAYAEEVTRGLYKNDEAQLEKLASDLGISTNEQVLQKITEGNQRRQQLKHYSGAMFYYAGEWYWGVDRLYHLEQRLVELGLDTSPNKDLLVPRPAIFSDSLNSTNVGKGHLKDDVRLTFEIYPSLRSPYTAMIFDKALQLAEQTNVNLVVKPVLPMVMRGVPATREKGFYIFADATREARALDVDYTPFYDPIGEPVRRCYSLYPWACEQGKGNELLSAFLRAAFVQGINTNKESGLKWVVENAGLDWQQAKTKINQDGWQQLLEQNRLDMYAAGLWGVPSFRLLDENNQQLLALWGQDRLWVIAHEIQRQIQLR